MKNRLFAITPLLLLLMLSGCITRGRMAFKNDSDTVGETGNSIFLMTVSSRNIYRPSSQLKLSFVLVDRYRDNGSSYMIPFDLDDKAKNESDDPKIGSSYLIRIELEPGNYVIRNLTSSASVFPFAGWFAAPLHSKIQVTDPSVFYLGHVSTIVRERKGNEFKAGRSFPLLDQAAIGASGGTFDIEISDQWEKDESVFKSEFPALAKVNIKKAILPPFDRETAQQWWEDH